MFYNLDFETIFKKMLKISSWFSINMIKKCANNKLTNTNSNKKPTPNLTLFKRFNFERFKVFFNFSYLKFRYILYFSKDIASLFTAEM